MRIVKIENGTLLNAETEKAIWCFRQENPNSPRRCDPDCAAFSLEDAEDEDGDEDTDDQLACCWGEVIGVME